MGMTAILPEVFPLSRAMVVRLLEERNHQAVLPLYAVTSLQEWQEQASRVQGQLDVLWEPLLQEVQELRERACEIVPPTASVDPAWFLRILQEFAPSKSSFTTKTVYRWRDRGLLRVEDGGLNYETTIAVLMMRLADKKRERGFLPPGNYQQDAYMYVWRQDTPQSPVIPCGLPIPDDVPSHAFLYTRWPGLGLYHPGWLLCGSMGSVRWRGTLEEKGTLLWNLSEHELQLWDDSIVQVGEGILDSIARQTRHTLANLVLLKRATLAFEQYLLR